MTAGEAAWSRHVGADRAERLYHPASYRRRPLEAPTRNATPARRYTYSLGYGLGRLLGLVLVLGVILVAVDEPIARAFLVVVFVQPRTLLRELALAASRFLS